ncbi:DNA polymerase III, partial [Candidatus Woesearchaeota archaeon]|nr:DNA polymerase III [Candidatus Woesearchaeota archaeon]
HLLVLMHVPGIGPKKTAALYKKLKITSLKQLEQACRKHKVRELLYFDAKTEREILEGIRLMKKGFGTRIPLKQAEAAGKKIVSRLRKSSHVKNVSVAGSLRRRKATVRDIDIIVSTKHPANVIEIFTKMPDVKKILAKGKRKATIILKSGIQSDIRVFPPEQWGSGLVYFTGNKAFNIKLRKIAIKKGYKLNEYGLFKGKTCIASRTEQEIFKKLGMKFIKPEQRES